MTTPRYADYLTVAASLRAIADKLDALAESGLPSPYVALAIQPAGQQRDDASTIAAVDAVSDVLFGHPGETQQMSVGTYHHSAKGLFPGIAVDVYNSVSSPEISKLQAEIAELRRQRDELTGGVS